MFIIIKQKKLQLVFNSTLHNIMLQEGYFSGINLIFFILSSNFLAILN